VIAIDPARRYIAAVRWLIPLVLVVVLAVSALDAPRVARPKLPRAVLAGDRWMPPEVGAPGQGAAQSPDPGSFDAAQTDPAQRASFDAATGTLTWLDDERYN
jgi:hypothetical protein